MPDAQLQGYDGSADDFERLMSATDLSTESMSDD